MSFAYLNEQMVAAGRCAQAMMAAADRWNNRRKTAGETPIRVSFGLHYGPVVLGDIGLTVSNLR